MLHMKNSRDDGLLQL